MRNLINLTAALLCGFGAAFASVAQCDKTTQAFILIGLVFVALSQIKK